MATSEEDVRWAYRTFLGRDPESPSVVANKIASDPDLRVLVQSFVNSDEFRFRMAVPGLVPLERPRLEVDCNASATDLVLIKDRIRETWSLLGIERPHDSVLAGAGFEPKQLDAQAVEKFYETGATEAAIVLGVLKRAGLKDTSSKICVEQGCGLGRVTIALAKRFKRVHGYDISPTHLTAAAEYAASKSISNVAFSPSSVDAAEDKLEECDFFYSRLVLQHNPPPLMVEMLSNALRALKPGGIAIFQLPTYSLDYSFNVKEYLAAPRTGAIEMHCLPQPVVFDLIAQSGCRALEVNQDTSTGNYGTQISNTFVAVRPAGGRRSAS